MSARTLADTIVDYRATLAAESDELGYEPGARLLRERAVAAGWRQPVAPVVTPRVSIPTTHYLFALALGALGWVCFAGLAIVIVVLGGRL